MNKHSVALRKPFVSRAVLVAAASLAAVASMATQAAVVDSGPVSLPVTNNIDGLYLNFITGANGNATVPGWDFNPYGTGGNLNFFTSSAAANNNQVVGSGTITVLAPGATVGPASSFLAAGVVTGTPFRVTGTNYVGVRFTAEPGGTLHYGYVELQTTGPSGFPATVTRYVYDNTPNTAVTIAGGAVAPTYAYTPATGSTVAFTGGGAVGSTSNGSITVALGTPAGSGTGAAATTTLTCTAPTAPFTGFAQTITAIGTGAISGTTLSGTCTRGATAVTQTLTCNENRGGTANARTWTLSCPAGTVAPPAGAISVSVFHGKGLLALLALVFGLGLATLLVRRQ